MSRRGSSHHSHRSYSSSHLSISKKKNHQVEHIANSGKIVLLTEQKHDNHRTPNTSSSYLSIFGLLIALVVAVLLPFFGWKK